MMGGIGNGLRSHPNAADNRYKARSVLGWGTAWEALRVPLTFSFHEVTQMTGVQAFSYIVVGSVMIVRASISAG